MTILAAPLGVQNSKAAPLGYIGSTEPTHPSDGGTGPVHSSGDVEPVLASSIIFRDSGKFIDNLKSTNSLSKYFYARLVLESPEIQSLLTDSTPTEALTNAILNGLNSIASCGMLITADPYFPKKELSSNAPVFFSAVKMGTLQDTLALNQMLIIEIYTNLAVAPVKDSPKSELVQTNCIKKLISKISGKLDKIDRNAEEWGRGSVSDVNLIDNRLDNRVDNGSNGLFALQYEMPTDFYMSQARQTVQGSASLSTTSQFSAQLAVQFMANPTLANAASNLMSAISTNAPTSVTITNVSSVVSNLTTAAATGTTNSSPTVAGATSSNAAPAVVITNVSPSQTNTIVVQTNMQAQLPENIVLKIGATDKITERILNYMSDPIHLPDNKKAYLGIMQVSMMPGWRTRKGYICEVQVNFEYALSKARMMPLWQKVHPGRSAPEWITSSSEFAEECRLPLNRAPSIISAFPFAEAQILDLASSYQRQLAMLAQIAGSIPQAPGLQAAVATSFNKLVNQNVSTRTALPLVVPSSQNADVTYRFDPELQALVNPASTSSGPGQLLEPSSFPALIVIVCEEEDLLDWDTISVSVGTRWIPTKHRNWFKRFSLDWWWYGCDALPYAPLSNGTRMENAQDFDDIHDEMAQLMKYNLSWNSYLYQELQRRFVSLRTATLGHTLYSALPLLKPHILEVYPEVFRRDSIPCKIFVQGQFFKTKSSELKSVSLGKIQFRPDEIQNDGHLICINIDEKRREQLLPGSYPVDIVTSTGAAYWTNGVKIDRTPAPVATSVISQPIREYATENPINIPPQELQILGTNFLVGGSDGLKVAIGGITLGTNFVTSSNITDNSIILELRPKSLGLLPGSYDLAVTTSGGESVLSKVITVSYTNANPTGNDLPIPPVVTGVSPDKFRLDSTVSNITIFGNFYGTEASKIVYVALGATRLDIDSTNSNFTNQIVARLDQRVLTATNYDLEVVNNSGRTVITNAVQILPTPAPVITALIPKGLQIELPAKGVTNPPSAIKTYLLALQGDNFNVRGLEIRLGETLVTTNEIVHSDNNFILLNLTNTVFLKPTNESKLELKLCTAGGLVIESNVIVATEQPPSAGSVKIQAVYPSHGFLYATSSFGLLGSGFQGSWLRGGAQRVMVGGRDCAFKVISDNELIFSVPPWSRFVSTNDLATATNKLDITVISPDGIGSMNSAISFDLLLPNDAVHQVPMTPEEQKISHMLEAVFYGARVMGTNPAVKAEVSLSATAGGKASDTNSISKNPPPYTANVLIYTNAPPPAQK